MTTHDIGSVNTSWFTEIKQIVKIYLKSMALMLLLIGGGALLVVRIWFGVWADPVEFAIVGLICGTVCFWGTVGARKSLNAVLTKLGKPVPHQKESSNWLIALLFMFPGLYLGYQAIIWYHALSGRTISVDWGNYKFGLAVALSAIAFGFILDMRADLKLAKKEAEISLEKSEVARLHAQLAALSAQTSPHMLFNALNTIASLIPTDPDTAEEMTIELADLLRGILGASQKKYHSLAEELTLAENYLQIEKKRFGDRLMIKFDRHDCTVLTERRVPALILQPLVENAVKYAISPRISGGTIRVAAKDRADTVHVTIEDNGPGPQRSTAAPGTGTGLENCIRRLEIAYGDNASLELTERPSGGTRVLVRIPPVGLLDENTATDNDLPAKETA